MTKELIPHKAIIHWKFWKPKRCVGGIIKFGCYVTFPEDPCPDQTWEQFVTKRDMGLFDLDKYRVKPEEITAMREDGTLYDDTVVDMDDAIERSIWGSYGLHQEHGVEYKLIDDLETTHLVNIARTQIENKHRLVVLEILRRRGIDADAFGLACEMAEQYDKFPTHDGLVSMAKCYLS